MNIIPLDLKVLFLNISVSFRKDHIAKVCGHKTKQSGELFSLGQRYVTKMPLDENGQPEYCLNCTIPMSIRCAWCGEPIHVGDPITLGIPSPDFEIPKYAVHYSEDETKLVGCLNGDCADNGAKFQGLWLPPGRVHIQPAPTKLLMGNNRQQAILAHNISEKSDLG